MTWNSVNLWVYEILKTGWGWKNFFQFFYTRDHFWPLTHSFLRICSSPLSSITRSRLFRVSASLPSSSFLSPARSCSVKSRQAVELNMPQCTLCHREVAQNEVALMNHYRVFHQDIVKYHWQKCHMCWEYFPDFARLQAHYPVCNRGISQSVSIDDLI